MILKVVLCGCETWSNLAWRKENHCFVKEDLQGIQNTDSGEQWNRLNNELFEFNNKPDSINPENVEV